jgi:DNA-binding CsgD family transcriptional regulator
LGPGRADAIGATVEPVAEQADLPRLSRRQRQTLQRLMQGDSEKEAAIALGITTNTLHCYVKEIYRMLQVNSRGELLAKCYRDTTEGPPVGRAARAVESN